MRVYSGDAASQYSITLADEPNFRELNVPNFRQMRVSFESAEAGAVT
jgi:hypothetical protein